MWAQCRTGSGARPGYPARLRDNRGNSSFAFLRRSGWRAVDSLFCRFAVEVLVVSLRVLAGMVDDAVPMIRRRIERIELQWNTAGINDVVIRPSRDDYCEASADRRPHAIENRLTGTLLHAKELVELMDFRPDLFLGL